MKIEAEDRNRIFSLYYGAGFYYRDLPHIYKVGMDQVWRMAWEKSFEDCQLILTPLSEISDADAIEVAKMITPDLTKEEEADICEAKGRIMEALTDRDYSIAPNTYKPLMYMEVFDFLRSRSYAIPYKGIDLIEAGLAITPSKTNK